MIIRVLLIASTVALLSQVISAANPELVNMNEVEEIVKEAQTNVNAKFETAHNALLRLNKAANDLRIKYHNYFMALKDQFALEETKLKIDAEFMTADNDLITKDRSLQEQPNNEILKAEKDAAKDRFDNIKKKKKDLDDQIIIAFDIVKKSEKEFFAAQNNAKVLEKQANKLLSEAKTAKIFAEQLKSIITDTSLVSTSDPLPTSVTPNLNRSTLSPTEQLIIKMRLNKWKKKASTRPPTMIGNLVRAWAKIYMEIANSLDRLKASIQGIHRNPNIN